MAYLIERKSQTIFVTATSIIAKRKTTRDGRSRAAPNTLLFNSSGMPEKFPVPWEEVYAAAKQRHEANLRLERGAVRKRKTSIKAREVAS